MWKTLHHGGRERRYLLHVPASCDGSRPAPLVLVFHGGGGGPETVRDRSAFAAKADAEGFIVAFPSGTGRFLRSLLLSWNAVHGCGPAREQNVDDVGFTRALVTAIESEHPIDRARIYAAGFSNGAMFCHRLAAEASDLVAAVAPVAGSAGGYLSEGSPLIMPPQPAHPVSVIAFHGTADPNVPYEGGHGPRAVEGLRIDIPVRESIEFWRKANDCDAEALTETSSSRLVYVTRYACPATGVEVVLYTIAELGHAWPSKEGRRPARWSVFGGLLERLATADPTCEVDATDVIWDFFERHPKKP